VRVIRDYSYCSDRFHGPGYLLAGDAACFVDPVFSTGVHLACLAGFLGARAVRAVLRDGVPQDDALAAYEASYRGSFERFLRFLYFFYDHNTDPDSYFWTARQVLSPSRGDLDARTAFVRLMSGGGDTDELADVIERERSRLDDAIRSGRPGALPVNGLLRVRTTERLISD
jgi:2-polyprenyl-6-methoxyphenol hydroxylase-like FAD-dependent oxidoreductase